MILSSLEQLVRLLGQRGALPGRVVRRAVGLKMVPARRRLVVLAVTVAVAVAVAVLGSSSGAQGRVLQPLAALASAEVRTGLAKHRRVVLRLHPQAGQQGRVHCDRRGGSCGSSSGRAWPG